MSCILCSLIPQIGDEKEVMYFRAKSEKERKEWMEAFRIGMPLMIMFAHALLINNESLFQLLLPWARTKCMTGTILGHMGRCTPVSGAVVTLIWGSHKDAGEQQPNFLRDHDLHHFLPPSGSTMLPPQSHSIRLRNIARQCLYNIHHLLATGEMKKSKTECNSMIISCQCALAHVYNFMTIPECTDNQQNQKTLRVRVQPVWTTGWVLVRMCIYLCHAC